MIEYQDDIEEEYAAEDYIIKQQPVPTDRDCLNCERKFTADNKYIRVCRQCKTSFTYYSDEENKILL